MSVRSKIKEMDSEHDTLLLEKEAAFAISKPIKEAENDNVFCYITFTSTSLRKNLAEKNGVTTETEVKKEGGEEAPADAVKEEKEKVKPEPEVEIPPDALTKDKCLQALAELRHSRWFTSRASSLPSCVECIRILRDLSRRDPVWACLSDWAVELLVERALYSAWRPLNPAASLMRVMEVLAQGLLFAESEDPSVIKDPCEHEETTVSPFTSLTMQEREDITKSAQYYLRLMHFRQIYRVLGMKMEEPEETKEEETETPKEETNDEKK